MDRGHLKIERECPKCKRKMRGPVFFRHTKKCDGTIPEVKPKVEKKVAPTDEEYEYMTEGEKIYTCEKVCRIGNQQFRCGNIVRIIRRDEKHGGFTIQRWDRFVPDTTDLVWGTKAKIKGEDTVRFEQCFLTRKK